MWYNNMQIVISSGRPVKQSHSEIYDAHPWAKDRLILESEYFDNNLSWNSEEYNFMYELLCAHPGMIILKKFVS